MCASNGTIPRPAPGEVLVEIGAVGLCGSDLHYYAHGENGPNVLRSPTALGHEAAGTVLGDGGPLPAGTRVAIEPAIPCGRCHACRAGRYNQCPHGHCFGSPPTDGALTGHLTVPAEFAHPLPGDLPLGSGALIEPLAVALHAVRRGNVAAGDRVLVTGAGPIGLLVLQAARAVGAGETVVTDINPGRLAHAHRLGADRTLDTSREPLPQEPLFDIALDCSGIEAALTAAAHAVRPGGTLVAVGNPPRPRTTLPLAWMQRQEHSLVTAFRYAGEFPAAVSLAAAGRVDLESLITSRFPLERSADAFRTALCDPAQLKVVIEP
ncbi:NAD(P)-dependent alcohol dehydrogenase [Streptomyces sp. MnatMP-M27]|uniref:NAD(P)-dependent alcohol dehydrogenase n=1 Tax=Streptomyces sp. MnatMP-M27 TaxID=1839768 RepID=UPI001C408585|nr:NAD(P)-dependent alcohol dehydrogenase [Streptomyces sp. MnatMP-M27]